MNMEALRKSANDPLWDEEAARGAYSLPLTRDNEVAHRGREFATGISQNELYETDVFLCARSPQTHIGPFRWAIDFLVPDGTPVLATRDGKIVEVKESSDTWGDGEEFRDALNLITIEHADGEYSQCCHLAKNSVAARGLRTGSLVRKGDQIGLVGKSGWTDRDHLHFIVFRSAHRPQNPFGFKSLKVWFS